MTGPRPFPECGQNNLSVTTTSSGAGNGAVLLPEPGGFFKQATFDGVVGADCGLTRQHAQRGKFIVKFIVNNGLMAGSNL